MKRFLLFLLLAVMYLTIITSCDSTELQSVEDSKEQEINLDLSQFEDCGEWSDGLIWCKSSHDDWEKGTTYTFAYYNEQGTKVSQDFDSEIYKPNDSENGWIIIDVISSHNYDGLGKIEPNTYKKLIYYSMNFNSVCTLYCYVPYDRPFSFSRQEDKLYFVGSFEQYADTYGLYCLNKDGSYIKFKLPDDIYATDFYYDDLEISEYDSGHYYIGDGLFHTDFEYIFDDKGYLILDLTQTKINNIYNINFISDNNIEVSFRGADNNYYICTMDLQGNIIKEPTSE